MAMQICAAVQKGRTSAFSLMVTLELGVQVPYWQSRIVQGCRKRGKPVIVATNMLESMIGNPTPTRAEVGTPARHTLDSDFAIVVILLASSDKLQCSNCGSEQMLGTSVRAAQS